MLIRIRTRDKCPIGRNSLIMSLFSENLIVCYTDRNGQTQLLSGSG